MKIQSVTIYKSADEVVYFMAGATITLAGKETDFEVTKITAKKNIVKVFVSNEEVLEFVNMPYSLVKVK